MNGFPFQEWRCTMCGAFGSGSEIPRPHPYGCRPWWVYAARRLARWLDRKAAPKREFRMLEGE